MPKGIGRVSVDPRHAWHYPVVQERAPGVQVRETWVRGKGLGGSSAINGLIWLRGEAGDYDLWRDQGCVGWDAAAMGAAFDAVERDAVKVEADPHPSELATAFFAAAKQAEDVPLVCDVNATDGPRAGACPHNIRRGGRDDAARTFLAKARKRSNVSVRTGVVVDRIVFEGRRAVGVDTLIAGERRRFRVAGEVLLSAGAIGSPTILQRSGVGDAERLRPLGIGVVAHRRPVGRHLRDHVGLATQFALGRRHRGRNHEYRGLRLVANVARYRLASSGPMADGAYDIVAFAKTRPDLARPDLQLLASDFSLHRRADPKRPVPFATVEQTPGFSVYAQLIQPLSEGELTITTPDPAVGPRIEPNWLRREEDQVSAVGALRLIRRLMARSELAGYVGDETWPASGQGGDAAAVLDTVRRFLNPGTHAVGSCRMGSDDHASVLDPELRVRGVAGVRVVDCSAMPSPVSANTHGPVTAFAWHAAAIIARTAGAALG